MTITVNAGSGTPNFRLKTVSLTTNINAGASCVISGCSFYLLIAGTYSAVTSSFVSISNSGSITS